MQLYLFPPLCVTICITYHGSWQQNSLVHTSMHGSLFAWTESGFANTNTILFYITHYSVTVIYMQMKDNIKYNGQHEI